MKEKSIFSIAAIILIILIGNVLGESSGSDGIVNLTIWDETDNGTKRSGWMTYFYANYTNATSGYFISEGSCEIRFQNFSEDYGTWTVMAYNSTYTRFQYNRTFNYKGTYLFNVNCSNSSQLTIDIEDNYTIENSIPEISKEDGADWIDFDGNDQNHDTWQCTEDTECYYNFTSNITEDDVNDILSYSNGTENTTLTDFIINGSGMLLINITHSNFTGSGKKIELRVKDNDPDSLWQAALLEVDVQEVNDAPYFVGLENWTLNMSENFIGNMNVVDEENNIEFKLNITFIECATAQWSDRNSTDCVLFNESHYSFSPSTGSFTLNFTPTRNDVGSYIVNFSVTDNSSLGNKTTSEVVNFTVYNVNLAPVFTYICDNERNATEDSEFSCWINASDIDEPFNLTFSSNYSWFTFNETGTNQVTRPCNITTEYNASAMVKFTPSDPQVGNWSINITVLDIGTGYGAPKTNSTIINFFIENVEDTVYLDQIANQTVYQDYTFYVNATDNDLLVPDTSVKDEVLTFASNTSWVSISPYYNGSNYTAARIDIDYDAGFLSEGAGNHTVKVNVTDTANNFAERIFTINLGEDNPPVWSPTMEDIFVIYEDNETYLNFSKNVSDADSDPIFFSGVSKNSFPSFTISSLGIINFTPTDQDVGYHNVTINATDGKLHSLKSFNFTVYNINDEPYIRSIDSSDVINATVDSDSNINCTEDNFTIIGIWTEDDDFKIPSGFKSFYDENHSINLTIEGPNTNLFSFTLESGFPIGNLSKFNAIFTPAKSDIGEYNVTINVSDNSNSSYFLEFNLTVKAIEHNPVLMNLTNQTSSINSHFYYRINASDIEDGNSSEPGNTNLTFSYVFNQGDDIFNSTIFNSTSGEINITFNSTQGGAYHLNITVNDSSGLEDTDNFWIYVYDIPNIEYPPQDYEYNLYENITSSIVFRVNNSIQDNLTYEVYFEYSNETNNLKLNISYYSNGTNLTWQFTPNFTDETYSQKINLTLLVYPFNLSHLNTSRTWNLTINHTNAPVLFFDNIDDDDDGIPYTDVYTVDLSDHFSDVDYSDYNYNQTVNFTAWSNESSSTISWSVFNFTLVLSSTGITTELITVNASDMENGSAITNVTSNSFLVKFISPPVQQTPSQGGSGGGGSSGETPKPISLKIVFPDPVEAYKKDKIELPIMIQNTGSIGLSGVNLTSAFKKNNLTPEGIDMLFSNPYFVYLGAGEKKNTTLTINVDTEETGNYEIIINASAQSPRYTDFAILHLKVKESNDSEVIEKLLFTEEFISENPECVEIKEIVDDAWRLYQKNDYANALSRAREAIDSCRYAISQPALPDRGESITEKLYKYTSFASLVLIVMLIVYYFYYRRRIKGTEPRIKEKESREKETGSRESFKT